MSLNERAEAVSKGYCEYHPEFERKITGIIDAQEDKMMDVWKITKKELYDIVMTSQATVLDHISSLKDMVTNFLNLTAQSTKTHEEKIEMILQRIATLERKYHDIKN